MYWTSVSLNLCSLFVSAKDYIGYFGVRVLFRQRVVSVNTKYVKIRLVVLWMD
jgi:hypothetical protein